MTRDKRGGCWAVVVVALCWGTPVAAQAPTTQPLVQLGDLRYLGTFTLPTTDGTGRPEAEGGLTYGGAGLGIGPDGASLYFGCHDWGKRLARVTIPAIGGRATVVEPCAPVANLAGVNPQGGTTNLGGALAWNGRLTVSAYTYYDAENSARASHFVGTNVANQAGPHRVGTEVPGMVAGYMGVVPLEWRSLLGGPALTGQCCLSIISRTSHGPTASVFDPANLGVLSPVPATLLVGYPAAHQTFGPWNIWNQYFTGATKMGGLAFPAGTRSLLFLGSHGATFCYGTGTGNQALAGTSDGQGGVYCYNPAGIGTKGTHGFPYHHQVWAYDANDLLAVKQGTKQPWDVRPYAVWTLAEMNNRGTANIISATYDPASRRLYAVTGSGDGAPTVHVYEIQVGAAPPPPPPPPVEVCGDGVDNDLDGLVDENCAVDCVEASGLWGPGPDVDGWSSWTIAGAVETRQRERTWTQTTPAAFGGSMAACVHTAAGSPAIERQVDSRPYTPPPVPRWTGIVRAQTTYSSGGVVAGMRVALQVPDAAVALVPPVGPQSTTSLLVPLPGGTTDRRTCTVYRIEPTGYSTLGARTRVTLQCQGLTGVSVAVEP